MSNNETTDARAKFIPNSKRNFWNSRMGVAIVYYYRQWRYRIAPKFFTAAILYIISYNVIVRQWKGEGHPINRFRWRIMERRGELSEEMLMKKKVVNDYFHSRLTGKYD
uniref:Photolyase/cryptochrome alpha/beta domain-containing protein n=1 Tax=Parascaris univalens TaxID=6257 RepID=A0A915B0L1_PARUN